MYKYLKFTAESTFNNYYNIENGVILYPQPTLRKGMCILSQALIQEDLLAIP